MGAVQHHLFQIGREWAAGKADIVQNDVAKVAFIFQRVVKIITIKNNIETIGQTVERYFVGFYENIEAEKIFFHHNIVAGGVAQQQQPSTTPHKVFYRLHFFSGKLQQRGDDDKGVDGAEGSGQIATGVGNQLHATGGKTAV